ASREAARSAWCVGGLCESCYQCDAVSSQRLTPDMSRVEVRRTSMTSIPCDQAELWLVAAERLLRQPRRERVDQLALEPREPAVDREAGAAGLRTVALLGHAQPGTEDEAEVIQRGQPSL